MSKIHVALVDDHALVRLGLKTLINDQPDMEVIGEAAKRVSPEARGRLASLDWKAICGMRDVLIHDYIGVDPDEVWNVAFSRIPELQTVLERDLAEGDDDPVRVS